MTTRLRVSGWVLSLVDHRRPTAVRSPLPSLPALLNSTLPAIQLLNLNLNLSLLKERPALCSSMFQQGESSDIGSSLLRALDRIA